MWTRCHKIVIGLLLAFTIGVHWPILQSLAWINMLVIYTQESGFEQAVVKTFDGNNPCHVCRFVAEGKKAEKEAQQEINLKKLDLVSFLTPTLFIAESPGLEVTPFLCHQPSRFYPPLALPDRA